ncbi:MAG: helix-turn-helix transcriptional regulator [Clostridia bacterium]|nr:helix-turn-helix transcriptional regulator [Clostridia bacterium]
MNIGKRITELRIEKGISVNKLANLAGVSQSYLRDIELGNKNPTVEYLSYICGALDVTMEFFFAEKQGEDELIAAVRKLTPKQRKKLSEFLTSLK